MVAKPLCPLYKYMIKPLDRAYYPELRSTIQRTTAKTAPSSMPIWYTRYSDSMYISSSSQDTNVQP